MPEITIGDLTLTIAEFSPAENARFDNAWDSIVTEYYREGIIKILDDEDKEITRTFAQAMKHHYNGAEFMGTNPTEGFGMRLPLPEDLISKAAAAGTAASAGNNWLVTWTACIQGAEQGWICDNTPNADTFDNEGPVVLRDANNNEWAFLCFGVRSLHIDPKIKTISFEINRKPQVRQAVETQLLGGDISLAKFGTFVWVPPRTAIKVGVETPEGGTDRLVPLGIIFDTATRSLDRTMGGTFAT